MDWPLCTMRGGICPARGLHLEPCNDTEMNNPDTRQNQNFPRLDRLVNFERSCTIDQRKLDTSDKLTNKKEKVLRQMEATAYFPPLQEEI